MLFMHTHSSLTYTARSTFHTPSCIPVVHISATPTPSRSCMAMHSYVIPISPQNPFSSTHAWPLQPLHLFLITTRSYSPHPSSMPSCLSSPPPPPMHNHLPFTHFPHHHLSLSTPQPYPYLIPPCIHPLHQPVA